MNKGYEVLTAAWSGNVRPWVARVYLDNKYIGKSGFCRTESAARRAGEAIAAAHDAKFHAAHFHDGEGRFEAGGEA